MGDRWAELRGLTPARIGLGRAGSALPTREVVRLGIAEAQARDAVWAPWDPERAAAELADLGLEAIVVKSAARTRAEYLKRPDLGRKLADGERERLAVLATRAELVIAVTNGLSSAAVEKHGTAMVSALCDQLAVAGFHLGPTVLLRDGRVASGDAIAHALGARIVVVVVGERPGLSSADSLGLYLTFDPSPGTTDERRNCISNVRPDGLPIVAAALKATWLATEALRRQLSGVSLKDATPNELAARPSDALDI